MHSSQTKEILFFGTERVNGIGLISSRDMLDRGGFKTRRTHV